MAVVLVVDDEPGIRQALTVGLRNHGYEPLTAGSGEEALALAAERAPDLMVLDLGLPDLDGIDVIRRLRDWSRLPVVVLSGHETQDEKIRALEAGADDYVLKPFDFEELLARVRAVLRRSEEEASPGVLQFGDLEIDLGRRLVTREGQPIHMTKTEYSLLEAFVAHPRKLLTHRWLLSKAWGPGYGDESNYLRVYVCHLREKLGDPAEDPVFIQTEPGVGYRWIREPDSVQA